MQHLIDPKSINLANLPAVPLCDRKKLPAIPGIYFAIDSLGNIQYIGRSQDINQRWRNHHREKTLEEIGKIKIAYLKISDVDLLPAIEDALIVWFNPLLNNVRLPSIKPQKEPIERVIEMPVTTIRWKLNEVMAHHRVKGSDLAGLLQLSDNAVSNLRNAETMPRIDGKRLGELLNGLNDLAQNLEDGQIINERDLIEYVPPKKKTDPTPTPPLNKTITPRTAMSRGV
ncbi:MAG: GIY-YIG nuclease family protein [Cyanobacteria bacterium SBLK]|nr:GIY-YIG nuclease family protein [Cyanobacteria bacterium SBLK]